MASETDYSMLSVGDTVVCDFNLLQRVRWAFEPPNEFGGGVSVLKYCEGTIASIVGGKQHVHLDRAEQTACIVSIRVNWCPERQKFNYVRSETVTAINLWHPHKRDGTLFRICGIHARRLLFSRQGRSAKGAISFYKCPECSVGIWSNSAGTPACEELRSLRSKVFTAFSSLSGVVKDGVNEFICAMSTCKISGKIRGIGGLNIPECHEVLELVKRNGGHVDSESRMKSDQVIAAGAVSDDLVASIAEAIKHGFAATVDGVAAYRRWKAEGCPQRVVVREIDI